MVTERHRGTECGLEHPAGRNVAAVERRRPRRSLHEMQEQWHFDDLWMMRVRMDMLLHGPLGDRLEEGLGLRLCELRTLLQDVSNAFWQLQVWETLFVVFARAHHEAPEQASVDAHAKASSMIMERPCANHVVGDVEGVGPNLVRTDLVGTTAVGALCAEGPRSVGVDPVAEAMNVEAVRRRIAVQHVKLEPIPRLRIDECARNAPAEDRLVDVSGDQLIRLGYQVAGVQVLSVDERREPARLDLRGRDDRGLMAWVPHAVAPILFGRHYLELRFHRAVVEERFDLQVDVANSHRLSSSDRLIRTPAGKRTTAGAEGQGLRSAAA